MKNKCYLGVQFVFKKSEERFCKKDGAHDGGLTLYRSPPFSDSSNPLPKALLSNSGGGQHPSEIPVVTSNTAKQAILIVAISI